MRAGRCPTHTRCWRFVSCWLALGGCGAGTQSTDSAPPPPEPACEGWVQGPLDPDAPISFWGPSLTETLAELAFTAEGTAERIDGEIAPVRLELSWNGSGPDFISRHELGGRCTVFVSFDLTVDHCEIDGVTLATRLDHGTTLILTEGDWPRVSSRGYASATGLEGSLLEPPSGTEDAWFGLTLDGVPPAADDWAWHLRLDASEPTDGTWDSVQEQWPFVRGTLYPTD